MADYQVGNLQIVFDAVDETASAFKDLSKNLRAIKNVINNLGDIDTSKLNSLKKNLQDITKAFSPFLTKVKGASQGLADFNSTIKQIGVKNLSSVSSEIIDIAQKAQQATQAQEEFTHGIENGNEQAILAEKERKRILEERIRLTKELTSLLTRAEEYTRPQRQPQTILGDIQSTKQQIEEAKQSLYGLMQAYKEQFYSAQAFGNLDVYSNIRNQIGKTEETISSLQTRLAQLQTEFGTPFNNAQAAVSALKNELLNVYYATNTINNEQVQEWQRLTAKINETTNAVNRALMSDGERVIAAQKAAIAAKQEELALLKANYALGNLNITSKEYAQRVDNLETEIKRLSGAVDEVDKPVKKTTNSWKKFLNQIKRVAIYRIIRTALKAVVSTFRDTINAFAQVDDTVNDTMSSLTTVNDTMSSLTSSLNIIKLSIGTSILPLLQMIEPIVSQIAVAFANLGNIISASMSKDVKFTKINAEYWEDYRKQIKETQGSLLDFDKFRVLNQQQGQLSDFLIPDQNAKDYLQQIGFNEFAFKGIADAVSGISKLISEIFETITKIGNSAVFKTVVGIVTELVGGLTHAAGWVLDILNNSGLIEPILGGILSYLISISATKIFTALSSGKLVTWIKAVVELLKTDLRGTLKLLGGDFVNLISSTKALTVGIGALAGSVFYFISSLDNMSKSTAWLVGGLSTLIGVLVGVATAIIAVKAAGLGFGAALKAAFSVGALTTAIGLAIGTAVSTANSSAKNNSAVSDRSTASIASTVGSSISYGGYSAQTTSINTSTSTEQAMYNALVRYNRENPTNERPLIVQLDGKVIFDNTRQTAKRRGLGFGNI